MRILVSIIWLTTLLPFGSRDVLSASTNVPLSFYIVSANKIEGGRFIDAPDFPKLGYIPAVPALVIARLQSVVRDGEAFHIQMRPDDARKLATLTERAVGQQMLITLGDRPLAAARVMTPMRSQNFQLVPTKTDTNAIEEGLRKLTK